MSEILLQQQHACMSILTEGAYVSTLQLGKRDILFPRTILTINGTNKLRGGMHVCLPQFGPGANSGLAHHGFGRTSEWVITQQSHAHVILTLQTTIPNYQHIIWQLHYALPNENEALFRLSVTNHGTESIRIAPGFHPYFLAHATKFQLGNTYYDSNTLSEPIFIPAAQEAIFDNDLQLVLQHENLPIYALWSDRAAFYTCIEPTAGGDALLLPAESQQYLHANEQKHYTLRICLCS